MDLNGITVRAESQADVSFNAAIPVLGEIVREIDNPTGAQTLTVVPVRIAAIYGETEARFYLAITPAGEHDYYPHFQAEKSLQRFTDRLAFAVGVRAVEAHAHVQINPRRL